MTRSVTDAPLDRNALDELAQALLYGCPASWAMCRAERVLGTVLVLKVYGPGWELWSPRQRERRLAEVQGLLSCDRATWRRYPVRAPS
jgi:hypothetical protein